MSILDLFQCYDVRSAAHIMGARAPEDWLDRPSGVSDAAWSCVLGAVQTADSTLWMERRVAFIVELLGEIPLKPDLYGDTSCFTETVSVGEGLLTRYQAAVGAALLRLDGEERERIPLLRCLPPRGTAAGALWDAALVEAITIVEASLQAGSTDLTPESWECRLGQGLGVGFKFDGRQNHCPLPILVIASHTDCLRRQVERVLARSALGGFPEDRWADCVRRWGEDLDALAGAGDYSHALPTRISEWFPRDLSEPVLVGPWLVGPGSVTLPGVAGPWDRDALERASPLGLDRVAPGA